MTMQVTIRPVFGEPYKLEVEPTDTVENLKAKIQDRQGTPPDQQRLIYRQRPMEDGRIMAEYNLQNDHTIDLAIRIRGGN